MDQIIGQIFTKEEADNLYGSVKQTIEMDIKVLRSVLTKTKNCAMFNIVDDKVIILGDGRTVLYPEGAVVGETEVFHLFSLSKVNELIGKGIEATVKIEKRDSVLSLTYGSNTLEFGTLCPPKCW